MLNVNFKLDSLWAHLEATSLSLSLLHKYKRTLVTGRNEVVMFLLVSVILLTGGGCLPQCMLGYHPLGADPPGSRHPLGSRHPPGSRPPPPQEADSSIWSMSGRYTSYWNAFLLYLLFLRAVILVTVIKILYC